MLGRQRSVHGDNGEWYPTFDYDALAGKSFEMDMSSSFSSNGLIRTTSAFASAAKALGCSPHPVMAITGVTGDLALIMDIRAPQLTSGITMSVMTRSKFLLFSSKTLRASRPVKAVWTL